MITFGLMRNSDGTEIMMPVDKVPNGDDCGCVCPECGWPLCAKNGGKKYSHFFAHKDKNECEHGFETSIHKMAKQILSQEKHMVLPGKELILGDKIIEIAQEKDVIFDSVDEECIMPCSDSYIVPDIICKIKDRILLVEIFVTHPVTDEKSELIKNEHKSCIQVNLNKYDEITYEELRDILLVATDKKEWINNEKEQFIIELVKRKCDKIEKRFSDGNYACQLTTFNDSNRKTKECICSPKCKYCWGKDGDSILCGYQNAVSNENDLFASDAAKQSLFNEREHWTDDRDYKMFVSHKCPICGEYMYINLSEDGEYVLHHEKCQGFSGMVDIDGRRVSYKNRYGKKQTIELPKYWGDAIQFARARYLKALGYQDILDERGKCPRCEKNTNVYRKDGRYFIGCTGYRKNDENSCKFKAYPDWEKRSVFIDRGNGRNVLRIPVPYFLYKEYLDRKKYER